MITFRSGMIVGVFSRDGRFVGVGLVSTQGEGMPDRHQGGRYAGVQTFEPAENLPVDIRAKMRTI